jgi:hypothetical protein
MRYFVSVIAIILSLFMLSNCKKGNNNFSLDYKYEYFPVDSGRYWVYKVDSINFREKIGDTSTYYIREYIESIYPDNIGRPTARIQRFRRNDTTAAWAITDVWFANLTQITAEKIEENLKFIKILFPPKVGQTWKGNRYIQVTNTIEWLDDWTYELQTLDAPKSIGNFNFDSTLTVLQHLDSNLFVYVYSTETYAKHVGLAYKELLNLGKQDPLADWTEPKEGFILKMTLIDYGN